MALTYALGSPERRDVAEVDGASFFLRGNKQPGGDTETIGYAQDEDEVKAKAEAWLVLYPFGCVQVLRATWWFARPHVPYEDEPKGAVS